MNPIDALKLQYWKFAKLLSREEPRGQELINRYRANYGLSKSFRLTEEMILEHWALEKELTSQLMKSTAENRWEIFEHCYTTLYSRLHWLNNAIEKEEDEPPQVKFADWIELIGTKPKNVYEIGSGRGELIQTLCRLGHSCTATEITKERGKKIIGTSSTGLVWHISDGIHFERFEPLGFYDIVLSDQVVEHLHPDDLGAHCKNVRTILKFGGKYILRTPHVWHGPADISAVFKKYAAVGMHLKEYTYLELFRALRMAGFYRIAVVFRLPKILRKLLRQDEGIRVSALIMIYLIIVEKVFALIPRILVGQRLKLLARAALLSKNIFIVAE